MLLQQDPETFRVLLGDGRTFEGVLPTVARRSLAPAGTPPLVVATALVELLQEYDALPDRPSGRVPLLALVGRVPGAVEELRSRLG